MKLDVIQCKLCLSAAVVLCARGPGKKGPANFFPMVLFLGGVFLIWISLHLFVKLGVSILVLRGRKILRLG